VLGLGICPLDEFASHAVVHLNVRFAISQCLDALLLGQAESFLIPAQRQTWNLVSDLAVVNLSVNSSNGIAGLNLHSWDQRFEPCQVHQPFPLCLT